MSLFVLRGAAIAAVMIALALPMAAAGERSHHHRIPVAELEHELEALKEEHGVTALLFGLWRGDREILTRALGTSMTGVPATTDMHFRIGAVSFTSLTTMLLQLAEQRLVRLDDPLAKWFPDLPQADAVTLRMLANSTAGYGDYVTNEAFIERFYQDVFADWSNDELIALGLEGGPLYRPGTDWSYAHTNYVLLGEVLEAVTDRSPGQLIMDGIVERLDLQETLYPATAELKEPVLHGFTSERGVFEDATFWNPSWTSYTGGLTSDLHDLGRLFRALAAGELISRQAYAALTAPTTVGLGPNRPDLYYGMGIAVERPWIWQAFSFGGYAGKVGYLPSRRLTMAVVATLGAQTELDQSPANPIFDALRASIER